MKQCKINHLIVHYTQQQNRMVERVNRTAMQTVRSMLVHANLIEKLWVEAMNKSPYIRNRTITRIIEDKISYKTSGKHQPAFQ